MPALPRPLGCDACQQTGFQGRVAVVESLLVNDDTRLALMAGVPLAEIQRSALEAGRYVPFARYASYLMSRKLIGPSDALLTVTE
jgi:general secretion pathway protein E